MFATLLQAVGLCSVAVGLVVAFGVGGIFLAAGLCAVGAGVIAEGR